MEPQPGAAAQVLNLPADCWPMPAAQDGRHRTRLADCPLGSQGSWRAVAAGAGGWPSPHGQWTRPLDSVAVCRAPSPGRRGRTRGSPWPGGKPLPCTLRSDLLALAPPGLPFTLLRAGASHGGVLRPRAAGAAGGTGLPAEMHAPSPREPGRGPVVAVWLVPFPFFFFF